MTPANTIHLSQEALDDVLIGLGSLESEAHLARCPECRAKFETFQSDMGLFNSASLEWSESKRPPARPMAHPRATGSRIHIAFVSWAAVAVLIVLGAFITWRHVSVAPQNRGQAVPAQPVDFEAQIEQDNQLLQAVNAAISPDDEVSPLIEYKIAERPHPRSKAHPKMRIK